MILRLLRKDPDERADAGQLTAVLQSILDAGPGSRRSARPDYTSPDRPVPQPTQTRLADLRSADAFEAIRSVGTDTGVEMLLDMPGYQAAQVLARYRPRARGELLQGIAATRPDVAGTILQMLSSVDIGPTIEPADAGNCRLDAGGHSH